MARLCSLKLLNICRIRENFYVCVYRILKLTFLLAEIYISNLILHHPTCFSFLRRFSSSLLSCGWHRICVSIFAVTITGWKLGARYSYSKLRSLSRLFILKTVQTLETSNVWREKSLEDRLFSCFYTPPNVKRIKRNMIGNFSRSILCLDKAESAVPFFNKNRNVD